MRAIMRDFRGGTVPYMREIPLDRPAWTVSSTGIWGVSHNNMLIHDDGALPPDLEPWRSPSLADCLAVPLSGLTAVSLFAGCGGSSLGLHRAGYDVRAACEFMAEVALAYEANMPETPVVVRDVREVTGAQLLEAARLEPGQLDLLDGSPPCTSFSTVGKRSKAWGAAGTAASTGDKVQRIDDLFFEYVRLLDELKPRAFIAENVTGLVKGDALGIFAEIVDQLRGRGYQVEARVLDASWLGTPQARERVIIVGFRDDLGLEPCFPFPFGPRPTMLQCLEPGTPPGPDVNFLEWPPTKRTSRGRRMMEVQLGDDPRRMPLQVAWEKLGQEHPLRTLSILEVRRMCGFPDDFDLLGKPFAWQWQRLGNSVPPPMMAAIAGAIRDRLLEVK